MKYNSFQLHRGHYDWNHPEKEQWEIVFYLRDDAPEELQNHCSFLLWETIESADFCNTSDAAYHILDWAKSCLYNSNRSRIEKMYNYLACFEEQDRKASLLEKKAKIEIELDHINQELSRKET